MAITVRLLADDDDADALGRLVLAAYLSDEGYPQDPGYEAELLDVAGRARAADVAVAALDGRVVGSVTYVAEQSNPMSEHDDPDAGAFRMLAVDPAVQGSGAGRALVQWCVERARGGGKRRLLIHSGVWMTRAHGLYERMGFIRRPDLDAEPVPGVHLLGYALEL